MPAVSVVLPAAESPTIPSTIGRSTTLFLGMRSAAPRPGRGIAGRVGGADAGHDRAESLTGVRSKDVPPHGITVGEKVAG